MADSGGAGGHATGYRRAMAGRRVAARDIVAPEGQEQKWAQEVGHWGECLAVTEGRPLERGTRRLPLEDGRGKTAAFA